MNETYIEKMRKDHLWFFRMSLLFGVLFVFCIYRNMSGITFPVLTAVLIGFSTVILIRMGITLRKDTILYGIGILLLGISTCLTSSGFLHFFNYVGILLLFSAAVLHQVQDDREWGFLQYMRKMFSLAGMWIISFAEPFRKQENKENVDKKAGMLKNKKAKSVGVGILIAVLFLCIVVPLLIQMFKKADTVALALETRGFQKSGTRSTYRELIWKKQDTGCMLFLFFFYGLLWFF